MKDYHFAALDVAKAEAAASYEDSLARLRALCRPRGVDENRLVTHLLERPVTLNFHIDRYTAQGSTVIDSLLRDGEYRSQFQTGTTNGGKSAHPGGQRFQWEQSLFQGAYPETAPDRPKYGALNVLGYRDGGAMRFGACFFTLKKEAVSRCTFCYGDSSITPRALCTADSFACVAAAMLEDVAENGVLMNQRMPSVEEGLAALLSPSRAPKNLGRNLDYYIETHVHGGISLSDDVAGLYLDGSYRGTEFEDKAARLCERYGIALAWIPERRLAVEEITPWFRGEKIPLVARRIDERFFAGRGYVNAELIGRASRDSMTHPEHWQDLGGEGEIFQYLKQLWHTVGYFGWTPENG